MAPWSPNMFSGGGMACHASVLTLAALGWRRREEHDGCKPAQEHARRQRLARRLGITARLRGLLRRLLGRHGGVLRELLGRSMLSGFLVMSVSIFLLRRLEFAATYGFERLLPPTVMKFSIAQQLYSCCSIIAEQGAAAEHCSGV